MAVLAILSLVAWDLDQRAEVDSLKRQAAGMEAKRVGLAALLEKSNKGRARMEAVIRLEQRISAGKREKGWTGALHGFAVSLQPGITLEKLEARAGSTHSDCTLRITGHLSGASPRLMAEKFRVKLHKVVESSAGGPVVSKFEMLEDFPATPGPVGSTLFVIRLTVGASHAGFPEVITK